MSNLLIHNATVICNDHEGRVIHDGALRIEGGRIIAIGTRAHVDAPDCEGERIDAAGGLVLPGLVCAHHHLYSTFARGMAVPGEPAADFVQILERLWWKLDRALHADDLRLSALLPLIECIRHGTTTIIDHHASPSCRDGSLDILAAATREAGLRACLCYEVSDRNLAGAGLNENARFIARCQREQAPDLRALMGLHASFTVGDATLERAVELADGAGFHVHVAEDESDQRRCLEQYGLRVVHRLKQHGLCGPGSIFGHCVHVDDSEIEVLADTGTWVAHNAESNMNNAVGAADVVGLMAKGVKVALGSDGMSSDMIAQMRAAYLLQHQRAGDPRVGFTEAGAMLFDGAAELAAQIFGLPLGCLVEGGGADLAIFSYYPPTPVTTESWLGHMLYGLPGTPATTTICQGQVLLRDGMLTGLDEKKLSAQARERAPQIWARVAAMS